MKMNITKFVVAFTVFLNVPIVVQAVEHTHEHDGQSELKLNHNKKWQIDNSLHIGMNGIKKEIMMNLDAIHYDKFSQKQYITIARKIDSQLSYLFKNCKLPPQADAQLHILLANIMQGSELMKSSEAPKQGAIKIIQSLNDYPQYFNDPAWQGLKH